MTIVNNRTHLLSIVLLFIFTAEILNSQQGELDQSFNPGLGLTNASSNRIPSLNSMHLRSDGKILISGSFTNYDKTRIINLALIDNLGKLDPNFYIDSALLRFESLARPVRVNLFSDRMHLLAYGDFFEPPSFKPINLLKFDGHGNLDASFKPAFFPKYSTNSIQPFEIQKDDKIILNRDTVIGKNKSFGFLTRLNPDGSLDQSFNFQIDSFGKNYTNYVAQITLQEDRKILLCGGINNDKGITTGSYIKRILDDGSLDPSFKSGWVVDSFINKIIVLPDNRILILGSFTNCLGVPRSRMALLLSDGSLDLSFDPGIGPNARVFDALILPNEKIMINGCFRSLGQVSRNGIARLHKNGSLDPTFVPRKGPNFDNSNTFDPPIHNMLLQSNGNILIGGLFTNYNDIPRSKIARVMGEPINSTIKIDSVNKTSFYVGDTLIVYYSVQGVFNNDNNFYIELNDGPSWVKNPMRIGKENSFKSGSLYGIIPDSLDCGTFYRVRLSSSNPKIISTEYPGDFYIWNKPDTTTIDIRQCKEYLVDKKIFTKSIKYIKHLANRKHCDSTLIYNITILPESFDTLFSRTCEQFISPGGKIKTRSENFSDTIPNHLGCDSVIFISLIISQPTQTKLSYLACDSIEINNTWYYSSGTYRQVLINSSGCDSIIDIELQLHHRSNTELNITACGEFEFVGGKILTNSGKYTTILSNQSGCDSVITLNLVIIAIDSSVQKNGNILHAIDSLSSYQWLDCDKQYEVITGANSQNFITTKSGRYAVELKREHCIDTSDCLHVVWVNLEQKFNFPTGVFPNPFNDYLFFEIKHQGDFIILMNDMLGRLIYKQLLNNSGQNIFKLDVPELKPGHYQLTVSHIQGFMSTHIVKEP